DGSSMVLEANSELTLDTLSNFEEHGMVDSTVRLRRGTVKTRVIKREPRSQFKTITPTAVASVRGTEYRVNLVANSPHQKQTALVEVYEGLVDVGAQQKNYDVPAEFGIVTKQGQAPQPPVKLLPAPAFKNLKNTYSIAMEPPNAPAEGLPIQWQALEGAEAFRLEILAANDSNKEQVDRLLQSRVVQQPQTHLTGLKPDCYYLRLRGIDALGLQGMATKRRVCLYPQISAPVAQLEDKNDSPNLLHLTWQAPQGAQSIRLEVAEDAGFERLIDEREMRADRFEAHYDAPVFLRMVALDAHGEKSPYSDVLQWQPGEKPEGKWWFLAPPGLYLLGLLLI
ncbi:MAG: FecR family protein, partial [Oleiphilaceae bacterium]|nr:FecR family protein [Oleiphilaceae bacterium]